MRFAALLLALPLLGAPTGDPRLVEAAKANNKPAARALLNQKAPANSAEADGTTCHSGTFSTGHRIDYCFVSSEHASRIRRAWIDEDADRSDHQPIWTDIDV